MDLSIPMKTVEISGKTIHLLGTAHVSKKSVDDVKEAVKVIQPDTICVELCESRLKSIKDKDSWKKMDIFKVIREKKSTLLMAQLLMSSFYRRLGKELEVTPGAEMIQGVDEAEGRELILADRNIEITLRRVWGGLSFFQKIHLMGSLIPSLFFPSEPIDSDSVEKLKESDHLEGAMEEFAQHFPGIRERLIDERDIWLAEMIKSSKGSNILAVVGAGHIPGIINRLNENNDLQPLSVIPPKSLLPRVLAWLIPILIVALIGYGFISGGEESGWEMVKLWVLINGTLSAIGALCALAHPLTIISAFIAAPITSLNPFMGAGYVTGAVQAFLKKPTVSDLESVAEDSETLKGIIRNPLTKILAVVILSSVGSTIGTFAAPVFMSRVYKEPIPIEQSLENTTTENGVNDHNAEILL